MSGTRYSQGVCLLPFRNDSDMGSELWKTDGIDTVQVADILPGSNGSSPRELVPFRNDLYFRADDGITGFELWKTDGTTTVQVADIFGGSGRSAPFDFTECNGSLYFRATGEAVGRELFKTDGTRTELVADLNPGRRDSDPGAFRAFRDELYGEMPVLVLGVFSIDHRLLPLAPFAEVRSNEPRR